MKKYYKINITINEEKKEINDEIIVTKIFHGIYYQEIVTKKLFYPLYKYPVTIKECIHNGEYMDGEDEIRRQLNKKGYSIIIFLDKNEEIEEINDENIIKEYYNNFTSTTFSKYITKEKQKKKIKERK